MRWSIRGLHSCRSMDEPGSSAGGSRPQLLEFKGICNASAAVALDEQRIVVGDDEQSWLSVHDLKGGDPLEKVQLPDSGEADVEGATVLKGRVVWITSHGRNKKGKPEAGRYRLFASHRRTGEGEWDTDLSRSYGGLPEALLATTDEPYRPLREAIGDLGTTIEALAPKKHGFNIEGLTVTEDGSSLLVGVRNPQPSGKAVLFRIDDPAELLAGNAAEARLGPVTMLDLGGRGIRDLAWSPAHHAYLIVAGQADDKVPGPGFALFTWAGDAAEPQDSSAGMKAVMQAHPDFHPEVIVPLLGRAGDRLELSARFLLISDDGSRELPNGQTLKDAGPDRWSFRAVIMTLD